MKNVIDISYVNTNIDYSKVNVDGVIIRIGRTGWGSKEMTNDKYFEQHYNGFKNTPKGIYWYSCATTIEEAEKEAKLTLEYLNNRKLELPIFWDTEDSHNQALLSKEELTKVGLAYCKYIEKHGYRAGIYGSKSWFENNLNIDEFKDYVIWVAQYNSTLTYKGHWDMWQYTSSGNVEGIEGRVDMNQSKIEESTYPKTKEDYSNLSIMELIDKIEEKYNELLC